MREKERNAGRLIHLCTVSLVCLLLLASSAWAGDEGAKNPEVKWQQGPCDVKLGDIAEIHVPEGYIFADGNDTKKLMESMENPVSGQELGLIAAGEGKWFVVFEYDESGYIKDDEKSSLDADAMLKSIRTATEESNKEREKKGWQKMYIAGWEFPPRYNAETHNLEWAIRGSSKENPGEDDVVVNYNTRLLGREGVMRVTVVGAPSLMSSIMPEYKNIIGTYAFQQGRRYAEYKQGDKLAQYGLTALVVGGASAAAVKTGLFKYIWKILVAGGIGIAALFKKLFSGKKED